MLQLRLLIGKNYLGELPMMRRRSRNCVKNEPGVSDLPERFETAESDLPGTFVTAETELLGPFGTGQIDLADPIEAYEIDLAELSELG